MKIKKWTFLIVGIILVLSIFSLRSGQKTENHDDFKSKAVIKLNKDIPFDLHHLNHAVNSYMESEYQNNTFPSAALAIVYGDSLIYEGAFGNKSAEDSSAIDVNSVFRIGSLSKGFNGILSSILADKNLISLEEKIKVALPELNLSNKDYRADLELKHLLSHSGGFPYHSYTNLVEAGVTISNMSKEFIHIENLTKPGSQYSYQNAAFSLSELVLQKKLRKPYSKILSEHIFQPLGMQNSSCSLSDLTQSNNVAYPQYFAGGAWKTRQPNDKYYNTISAGGINASISDMALWMKALLYKCPDVISEKSIDTAFKPFIETKTRHKYYNKWPDFHNSYYGYGWRIHTLHNSAASDSLETIVHHGGQVNGYRSEIMINQKQDYGICVLFSNYSLLAKTIIPDLKSILEESEKVVIKKGSITK